MPWWAWTWPTLALIVLVAQAIFGSSIPIGAAEGLALVGTVFAAVYHAEVVAHRIGEPFGSLVLAVAVTVIEVALIVSIMIVGGVDTTRLARDTVFAAVMIVCNGIVGLCLLAGGLRHREQVFQLQGAQAALSVIIPLTTLTLVLPNVTSTTIGPTFSSLQLAFVAIVSLALYGSFLFVQTVRHRDYFLPEVSEEDAHALPPPSSVALLSAGLLFASLILVVVLAKLLTPTLELVIASIGAPRSVVGIVIAGLVLLPEGLASYRAARANRLQTSMNLALGSVLATIGLTIPAVAGVSILLSKPLTLGLGTKEELLLALTLIVSLLTIGTGRTSVLQGIVHLVVFAVFLFLSVVP
ncbi:MAG TPA: ionic transporter y4hA [Terriglobales bacterium]|jgi:Ca2+:H+ antiporter|nr:ionic transporter y4hA [Terriglobales bacterium]